MEGFMECMEHSIHGLIQTRLYSRTLWTKIGIPRQSLIEVFRIKLFVENMQKSIYELILTRFYYGLMWLKIGIALQRLVAIFHIELQQHL
jgi:hypothetical protein